MAVISNWPDPTPDGLAQAVQSLGLSLWADHTGTLMCRDDDIDAVEAAIKSYAGSDVEASFVRQQRMDELAAIYTDKIRAGRLYAGKTWQIDTISQGRITAISTLAAFSLINAQLSPWPVDGYPWIAIDNTQTKFDAAGMVAFAQDIASYVAGLILNNRALKDALLTSSSAADILAVDLTANWPK